MTRDPLWEILEDRGIKKLWFARRVGYSRQYLHGVRVGKYPITAEFRRRAAEAMNLPESVLFRREEVPA